MAELWEKVILSGVVILFACALHFVSSFVIRRMVRVLSNKPDQLNDDLTARARALLAKASGASNARHRQRVRTLGSLLGNISAVVLWTLTIVTILAIFGVPMGPILTSAGIGGVALGFGAQSLVKDYLSGIFMLAEDQFGVGDSIKVGDISGTVLEVTLRVTKVRDGSGVVWYLRNGEVLTLGNVSQGFSTATVDVPVAADEDPDKVEQVLRQVVADLAGQEQWANVLLEDPAVLGLDAISGGTMTFKVSLKTGPDQQWAVSRELRAEVAKALNAAGISGPRIPMIPQN